MYDRALRERAVKMSYERASVKDFAAGLGLSSERLYKWRAELFESLIRPLKCEMIYGNKTLSAEQMDLAIFEYLEI